LLTSTTAQTLDILDQEAAEDEMMLEKRPELQSARAPSYEANRHLTDQVKKYQATLNQARKSDADVREKWAQWEGLVAILAGGEVGFHSRCPSSRIYRSCLSRAARAGEVHTYIRALLPDRRAAPTLSPSFAIGT
jgi:programmed cell death 6-interacting protein